MRSNAAIIVIWIVNKYAVLIKMNPIKMESYNNNNNQVKLITLKLENLLLLPMISQKTLNQNVREILNY
jgi:hypothetical protein